MQKPVKYTKNRLILKCSTWNKDSHELYDYECLETSNIVFSTNIEGCVSRKAETLIINSQE